MDESGESGGREGGRRSKEVSMLRIDHSDVYLENERLNDALLQSIDSLHRRHYRKVLSRDSEINQVRQSLLHMRQNGNPESVLSRSNTKGTRSKLNGSAKPTSEVSALRNSNNNNNTNNNKRNKNVVDKNSENRNISTPNTFKNIEVRMPRANKLENSDDSSDNSDDDDNGTSDENSDDNNETVKRNRSRPTSRGNQQTRPDSRFGRQHNLSPSRQPSRNVQDKNHDILRQLMFRLKMDKIPPAWFTDVVPATDVHVAKRPLTGHDKTSQKGTTTAQNPHRSPRSRQHLSVRPSTSGDFSQRDTLLPQQRLRHVHQRPSTSIGISRWEENINGRQTVSNPDRHKSLSNNHNDSRPSTVLFCGRPNVSKTLRQLKEEELQASVIKTHNSTVDILLKEAKEERKTIDEKVKVFVKSLDERKKSERLKNMLTNSMMLNSHEAWEMS